MIYVQLALTFLRGNWRWMLPLAACLAVLAILAYARFEHDVARHATQAVKVAEKQSQNTDNALKATERVIKTETVIREQADHTVQSIQSQPGASDELPPAVRDSVCAGLGELRHGPVCSDHNSDNPTRPMPGS